MRISDWSSDVCSSDLNPRSTSLDLEARITYADGSTDTWQVPEGSPIGTNLRYYRWRKWLERIRSDSYRGLWPATAEWVAAAHSGRPPPVVPVEPVRFFRSNVVQGAQPPSEEYTYFTLAAPSADVACQPTRPPPP